MRAVRAAPAVSAEGLSEALSDFVSPPEEASVKEERGASEGAVPAQGLVSPELAERLVEENLGWLRGWVRGRVSDPEAVHDICQDSLLKALRSLDELKDVSRFPSWLYRIATNTLRDHLRRKVRRSRWLQYTGEPEELERAVRTVSPDALGEKEEVERLLEDLRQLPERYREPLLLRHSRGLSYLEIGRILGISENAVQVRIFRARKMLRDKMEGRSATHDGVEP